MSPRKNYYHVRHMRQSDNEEVLDICNQVDIVTGLYTGRTMLQSDNKSIFVAEEEHSGALLGVCSGTILSRELAFVGLYAVRPEYQGQGVGLATWSRAIDHVDDADRNIGLFGDAKMIRNYRDKSGFAVIPQRRLLTFAEKPRSRDLDGMISACPRVSVVDLTHYHVKEDLLNQVIKYDSVVCGLERKSFLENSLFEPGTVAQVAVSTERGEKAVVGYILVKQANKSSLLVGPLYADRPDIAEVLLSSGLALFTSESYKQVLAETWSINATAIDLCQRLKLSVKSRSPIMFTNYDVPIDYKPIYFVTESDFFHT